MGGRHDPCAAWRRRAVDALTDSIAHWERLRDGTAQPGESTGPSYCACCREWSFTGVCGDCPIALHTGQSNCIGTPYDDAADAYLYGDDDDRRRGCQREVKFLRTVRHLVRRRKVNP